MLGRSARRMLLAVLLFYSLFPFAVLFIASCLPLEVVRTTGVSANGLAQFRGPSLQSLWQPENIVLWWSLARSVLIAFSVSFCAAIIAISVSYVASRRRSPWARVGIRALALAAYGLPSIFLLFGLLTMLLNVTNIPLVRVWLIHFFYIFPMSLIVALGYATTHSMQLDRSAALDGALWCERFWLIWRSHLWRGHVAIFSIGALISWGDIVFSQQLLPTPSRLLADLYVYRYFDLDTTVPDYPAAAMFSLVLTLLAAALATLVAITNREGAR